MPGKLLAESKEHAQLGARVLEYLTGRTIGIARTVEGDRESWAIVSHLSDADVVAKLKHASDVLATFGSDARPARARH